MKMNVLKARILAAQMKTAVTLMDHTLAHVLMGTREMLLASVVTLTNAPSEAIPALILSRPVLTTLALSTAPVLLDTRETQTVIV